MTPPTQLKKKFLTFYVPESTLMYGHNNRGKGDQWESKNSVTRVSGGEFTAKIEL